MGACCSSCARGGTCESRVGAAAEVPLYDLATNVLPFTPFAPLAPFLRAPGAREESSPRARPATVTAEQEAQFRSLDQRWESLLRSRLPEAVAAHASVWLPFAVAWRSGDQRPGELSGLAARVDALERMRLERMRIRAPKGNHRKLAIGAGLVAVGVAALCVKKVLL